MGNLQSTPQQQVINDGGDIEIVPADPQVIYVPVYQPSEVYYQSALWRLHHLRHRLSDWLRG